MRHKPVRFDFATICVTQPAKRIIIKDMDVVHMTSAEVTNDFASVLDNLRKGVEVIVEQDHLPVAIIRSPEPSPKRSGRLISEVIADLKARGSNASMDEDFARDIDEGIAARQQPWNPPTWD